jgi:hypothetical protein
MSKACSNQAMLESGTAESAAAESGTAESGTAEPGSGGIALRRAGDLLREAGRETDRGRRYGLCRLAALNSAWAACAAAVGAGGSPGAADPWALLVAVRPGLAEWASVFAAVEQRWAAVRRGARPGDRELDDLLREATAFRGLVAVVVGARLGAPLP